MLLFCDSTMAKGREIIDAVDEVIGPASAHAAVVYVSHDPSSEDMERVLESRSWLCVPAASPAVDIIRCANPAARTCAHGSLERPQAAPSSVSSPSPSPRP